MGNVDIIIDGEAGSCGKGKLIAEYALHIINLGAAVTNCMPNAGHTYVDENGNVYLFRNIPVSCVNPNTELFIGPGSAIDMETFIEEYERLEPLLNGRKIYVHEMVPLIEKRHKIYERKHIKSGSTFKGCGAVSVEKIMRDKNLKFFKTYKNAVVCSNKEWLERLHAHINNQNERVLLEGSQGCSLSINFSGNYPHVTSRNVSASQLLADSGISPFRVGEIIMVIRAFPIRISNVTNDGRYINTGQNGSGRELTWSEVNLGALNGVYPYRGNCPIEVYYELAYHAKPIFEQNMEYILYMYKSLPKDYKMQLCGGKIIKSLTPDRVNLENATEIERLYWKSLNVREYTSFVIAHINNNGRVFEGTNYNIRDLSELTSVTRKERKIYTNDIDKLKCNVIANEPTGIYLNFAQHLDIHLENKVGEYSDLVNYPEINMDNLDRFIEWIESECGVPVVALGTGARNGQRIRRRESIIG